MDQRTTAYARKLYVSPRVLPDLCQPAHVVRTARSTLLMVDVRATQVAIGLYCVDELWPDELAAMRAAYGPDRDLTGLCDTDVPDELRLPGDPPPPTSLDLARQLRQVDLLVLSQDCDLLERGDTA